MTLAALADQLGVTTASVWLWENRNRVPIASTIRRVAQIFDVNPTALMEPRTEAAAPEKAPPPDLQDLIRAIEAKGFRVQITPRRKQG
ncbi:helix-turn-helix domain-containing protein [Bradyrhizobium sp. CCBAU 53340]|uniref:helix-turn-helix domain-containing protein n=1 Tax=Bradyrhizobium sp. CCBAU 53340 TaxID=1325112 RepID=UPI00188C9019|nr:helix-turn-helix transcriptional regulator [Bradyrhizobium sp. CCBAU 53340]